MIKRISCTRRFILKSISAMSLYYIMPPKISLAASNSFEDVIQKLLYSIADKDSAKSIGNKYLSTREEERNLFLLLEKIIHPKITNKINLNKVNRNDVLILLNEVFMDDFSNEQIVKVDGWIFSETEARLCALSCIVE